MDERTAKYYLQCGIKKKWHGKNLSDLEDKEILSQITKYIDNSKTHHKNGMGLYLFGTHGTGKSLMMNCAFKEFINKSYSVQIYGLEELIDEFALSWKSDEAKARIENAMKRVDFLGIDEFGKKAMDKGEKAEPMNPLAKRVLESVIRYRTQQLKPIWITSNVAPVHIKNTVSEAVASLLNESVLSIKIEGEDYREIIAKENRSLL